MFTLALLIYLIATTSLSLHLSLVVTAFIVDLIAWATIQNSFKLWVTGSTVNNTFDDE